MEEEWVVPCQALYKSIGDEEWYDMHESSKEVCKIRGQEGRSQNCFGVAHVRKGADVFDSLLETWNVHIHKALRICERSAIPS